MEGRIVRLECDVAYLRSDLAEMKAEIRQLRDKVDRTVARPTQGIVSAGTGRLGLVRGDGALLFAYFVVTAILLVAMWKGFGWI